MRECSMVWVYRAAFLLEQNERVDPTPGGGRVWRSKGKRSRSLSNERERRDPLGARRLQKPRQTSDWPRRRPVSGRRESCPRSARTTAPILHARSTATLYLFRSSDLNAFNSGGPDWAR
jgi:hypothetical protein